MTYQHDGYAIANAIPMKEHVLIDHDDTRKPSRLSLSRSESHLFRLGLGLPSTRCGRVTIQFLACDRGTPTGGPTLRKGPFKSRKHGHGTCSAGV